LNARVIRNRIAIGIAYSYFLLRPLFNTHTERQTTMNATTEQLKDRIEAKWKHTEARILELKADANEKSHAKAKELEKQLEEIERHISDGYDNLQEATVSKLNEWLKD
jgi:hypothetical protein